MNSGRECAIFAFRLGRFDYSTNKMGSSAGKQPAGDGDNTEKEYDLRANSEIISTSDTVIGVYKSATIEQLVKVAASLDALPITTEFVLIFYVDYSVEQIKEISTRFTMKSFDKKMLIIYTSALSADLTGVTVQRMANDASKTPFTVVLQDTSTTDLPAFFDVLYTYDSDTSATVNSSPKFYKSASVFRAVASSATPTEDVALGNIYVVSYPTIGVLSTYPETDTYVVYYKTNNLERIVQHMFTFAKRLNNTLIYEFTSTVQREKDFFTQMCKDTSSTVVFSGNYAVIGKSSPSISSGIVRDGKISVCLTETPATTAQFYIKTNEQVIPTSPIVGRTLGKISSTLGDQAAEVFVAPLNPSIQWTSSVSFDFVVFKLDNSQMKILFLLLQNKSPMSKRFIMIFKSNVPALSKDIISEISKNANIFYVSNGSTQFIHNITTFDNPDTSLYPPVAFRVAYDTSSTAPKLTSTTEREVLFNGSGVAMFDRPTPRTTMPILGTTFTTSNDTYFVRKPVLFLPDGITTSHYMMMLISTFTTAQLLHLIRQLDYRQFQFAIVVPLKNKSLLASPLWPAKYSIYTKENVCIICKADQYADATGLTVGENKLSIGSSEASDIGVFFDKSSAGQSDNETIYSVSYDGQFSYGISTQVSYVPIAETISGGPVDLTLFTLSQAARVVVDINSANLSRYIVTNGNTQFIVLTVNTLASYQAHASTLTTLYTSNINSLSVYTFLTYNALDELERGQLRVGTVQVGATSITLFRPNDNADVKFVNGLLSAIPNAIPNFQLIASVNSTKTDILQFGLTLDRRGKRPVGLMADYRIANITSDPVTLPIFTDGRSLLIDMQNEMPARKGVDLFDTMRVSVALVFTSDFRTICRLLSRIDLAAFVDGGTKYKFLFAIKYTDDSLIANFERVIMDWFNAKLPKVVTKFTFDKDYKTMFMSNDDFLYANHALVYRGATIDVVENTATGSGNINMVLDSSDFENLDPSTVKRNLTFQSDGADRLIGRIQLNIPKKTLKYISKTTDVFTQSAGITMLPPTQDWELFRLYNLFNELDRIRDILIINLDRELSMNFIPVYGRYGVIYDKRVYSITHSLQMNDKIGILTVNVLYNRPNMYFKFGMWLSAESLTNYTQDKNFTDIDADFVFNTTKTGTLIEDGMYVHTNRRSGLMKNFFGVRDMEAEIFPTLSNFIEKERPSVGFCYPINSALDVVIDPIRADNDFIVVIENEKLLRKYPELPFLIYAKYQPVAVIISMVPQDYKSKYRSEFTDIDFETFQTSDVVVKTTDFFSFDRLYDNTTVYVYPKPTKIDSTSISYIGTNIIYKLTTNTEPGFGPNPYGFYLDKWNIPGQPPYNLRSLTTFFVDDRSPFVMVGYTKKLASA